MFGAAGIREAIGIDITKPLNATLAMAADSLGSIGAQCVASVGAAINRGHAKVFPDLEHFESFFLSVAPLNCIKEARNKIVHGTECRSVALVSLLRALSRKLFFKTTDPTVDPDKFLHSYNPGTTDRYCVDTRNGISTDTCHPNMADTGLHEKEIMNLKKTLKLNAEKKALPTMKAVVDTLNAYNCVFCAMLVTEDEMSTLTKSFGLELYEELGKYGKLCVESCKFPIDDNDRLIDWVGTFEEDLASTRAARQAINDSKFSQTTKIWSPRDSTSWLSS